MEETQEPSKNRPWLFQKGNRANPGGRPKGSKSLKTWCREYLESLNEEEKEDFIAGLPKEVIWKMAEGNPHQTSDENIVVTLPKPILGGKTNGIPSDNSSQQNTPTQETT